MAEEAWGAEVGTSRVPGLSLRWREPMAVSQGAVVGSQKIVSDLDAALQRTREYILPWGGKGRAAGSALPAFSRLLFTSAPILECAEYSISALKWEKLRGPHARSYSLTFSTILPLTWPASRARNASCTLSRGNVRSM